MYRRVFVDVCMYDNIFKYMTGKREREREREGMREGCREGFRHM